MGYRKAGWCVAVVALAGLAGLTAMAGGGMHSEHGAIVAPLPVPPACDPAVVQKHLSAVADALAAATKAVEAGEKDKALAALNDAKTHLAEAQKACAAAAPATKTVKVVNVRCPIMGGALKDPNAVPEDLTREFKGQKVGFCCAMCPPQWDKLSDADKDAKLKAAMSANPPARPTDEHHH